MHLFSTAKWRMVWTFFVSLLLLFSGVNHAVAQNTAATAVSSAVSTNQENRQSRTYVLVHGAWFGGWVWKDVAQQLRAAGNTVYTPSLTGLGDRRHLRQTGINLDTHTDDIVNLILDEDLHNVVLVGWSYGGMVISNVVAKIPDRIASMVYLDAYFPEKGRSAASYIPDQSYLAMMAELAGNNQDIPPLSMQEVGITDAKLAAYVAPRISPQPVGTFLQPSKTLTQRPKHIAYTFILAGRFNGALFRPIYQRFQQEHIGDTFVVNSSHAAMLTAPKETAELLQHVR